MAIPVTRMIPVGMTDGGPNDASPEAPVGVLDPHDADTPPQVRNLSETEENEALLSIVAMKEESWSVDRKEIVRRCVKAFEYLKGNPYYALDESLNATPLDQVLSGQMKTDDPDLYQFCDNVYQMLCFSFMAALSNDVPKVRFMPGDPEEESDLSFAKQASSMMAYIERINDLDSKAKLELLYMFTCGSYFSYTRNIVDAGRAGVTQTPMYEMQDTEVEPNRYGCPQCATQTPVDKFTPFAPAACPQCGANLDDSHFFPAESMQIPTKTGVQEYANTMPAIDVYCHLQVSVDSKAERLEDSPMLILRGEIDVAAIRASYPEQYSKIGKGVFADSQSNGETDRRGRDRIKSQSGATSQDEEQRGTYSRCWIHAWAFNSHQDQEVAQALTRKYPKGVKVVFYGENLVLEKVPESMMDRWTVCRTIEGIGMAPMGVGDVALDVQNRINNNVNNVELYDDSMAVPPVMFNAQLIDSAAFTKQPIGGGRNIPIFPAKDSGGRRFTLGEAVFQPQFHMDAGMRSHGLQLVQMAQLLTGIQPQVFGGGTTPGVDTAAGQKQMLNTALGRLLLFLQNMRAERARRAVLAVRAFAASIDTKQRITMEGSTPGEYENLWVFQSEVQGQIEGYPEGDQGFPSSYEEMRDRLIQLIGMAENNPILQHIFSDPDMEETVSLYLLPPGSKLPNSDMRTKIKLVLQVLAQQKASLGPNGILLPSVPVDPDFDDPALISQIATDWATRNWQQQTQNPEGFENVRAYFRMASANAAKAQALPAAQHAIAQQALAGGGPQAGLPAPQGAAA